MESNATRQNKQLHKHSHKHFLIWVLKARLRGMLNILVRSISIYQKINDALLYYHQQPILTRIQLVISTTNFGEAFLHANTLSCFYLFSLLRGKL